MADNNNNNNNNDQVLAQFVLCQCRDDYVSPFLRRPPPLSPTTTTPPIFPASQSNASLYLTVETLSEIPLLKT